jgi:hypothetical protein
MIVGNKATGFFTFIKPDNPFYPQMQRLIKVLSENPLQDKILEWSQKSGGKAVHTDIRGAYGSVQSLYFMILKTIELSFMNFLTIRI